VTDEIVLLLYGQGGQQMKAEAQDIADAAKSTVGAHK